MATQFVKWWKTKFHASTSCGYKNISVLGSDASDNGTSSDREDLMRDDASSTYNNRHGAHVNPGLAYSTTTSENSAEIHEIHEDQEDSHNEIKFEDFECDVQVEGSESGEERKEFSFTFYDLDGHGKITKDDIAGLVRSIYGAVNDTSIKVPEGGKKTVKVKLTVTPETSLKLKTSELNAKNLNNSTTIFEMGNINSSSSPLLSSGGGGKRERRVHNNVNVTIQENLNLNHSHSYGHDGVSGRRNRENKPKFSSVRIPNSHNSHSHGHHCRGYSHRNLSPDLFRECTASPLRNRKKWREMRQCSLQRPDLFELLKSNMEKNNVNPCCRHQHQDTHPNPPPPSSHPHPHPHHHSPQHCTHNQILDPNCPVLPLIVNENLFKQKYQTDGLNCNNNNNSHKNNHIHHHSCNKKHGHNRSRSHDLSQNLFSYHLLGEKDDQSSINQNYSQSPYSPNINVNPKGEGIEGQIQIQTEETNLKEIIGECILNQHQHLLSSSKKNTNLELAPQSSPHQLKHKNREVEHKRAMAQVINWLERENIGGGKEMEKKFSSPNKNHNQNPKMQGGKKDSHHQHHYHHHHVHHHYHHYGKETPIIV